MIRFDRVPTLTGQLRTVATRTTKWIAVIRACRPSAHWWLCRIVCPASCEVAKASDYQASWNSTVLD